MRKDTNEESSSLASTNTDQAAKGTDTRTLKEIIKSKEDDVELLGGTQQTFVTKTRASSAPNPEAFIALFSSLKKGSKK